jgi:NAD(P)-dependent dehydrogenase (short-subunit alcohol dehydrogenase family)
MLLQPGLLPRGASYSFCVLLVWKQFRFIGPSKETLFLSFWLLSSPFSSLFPLCTTSLRISWDLQSKKRYKFMGAYGQSKLALVLFTYELARRLEGTGVTANCLHPGFVATNIGQSGVGSVGRAVVKFIFSSLGISPEEGAKTSIYLASSPDVEGVTGKYFVKSIPKRSAPITYDESLQRQLWEESARLVKLGVKV